MNIVSESLENLNTSAGLVIVQDDKILLEHPTGQPWFGSYSIPKGHVENGENFLDAAIRETREEIGINIDERDIHSGPHLIEYKKNGNTFKKVIYFIAVPSKRIENSDIKLQKNEVDWAGFLSKDDAKKRIFWRLKEVLDGLI